MRELDAETIGACGIHFGVVSELLSLADQPPKVRVLLPQLNNLPSPWLKMLHPKTLRDQFYWLPDIGEQVVVLLDAAGEQGVVLGCVYSKVDVAPALGNDVVVMQFNDGTRLEYNRAAHVLLAKVAGDVVVQASGNVQLVGKTISLTGDSVTINGPLHVTGPVEMDAAVKTGALQVGGDVSISGKLAASGNLKTDNRLVDYKGTVR